MDKGRELLKAQAMGDVVAANRLNSGLSEDEREHYYLLALALFAGLIGHHFGDEPTHDEIRGFVNETRHDYRDADPAVDGLVMEALIRAVFGEDHLLDNIAAEEQYLAQLPVIRKIAAQSEVVQQRLDDFLTDAQNLARQWSEGE